MRLNELPRYDIAAGFDGYTVETENPNGDWVRFSDAKRAVQQAQVDTARIARSGDDAVIREKNKEIERLQAKIDGMIPRPKVEAPQMNSGDDRMFGVTVNSVLLFKSSEDDAENVSDAFATRIRQALNIDETKEGDGL